MFALANVFHFFAHKLTCLRAGGFALMLVFARSFDCFFFWHINPFSPLATLSDVENCVERQHGLLLAARDS